MRVDVRVGSDQLDLAVAVLRDLVVKASLENDAGTASLVVDEHPPAAGPEAQITVTGVTESLVRESLAACGVWALATRSRA